MAELDRIRHSAAHVMAEAVLEMFPDAKFGIGPSIEDGFYYDFELPRPLKEEDLKTLQKAMQRISKKKLPFERREIGREEALELFKDQPYKLELIRELPETEVISTFTQGSFTDLCRGPHVEHSGEVGAFKLLSVAGAYWRGDERRPMLQRIYGTAWETKEDLVKHLDHLAEAARRDHRKLGKELDLFSIHHEDAGGGLVFWHPKGSLMRKIIEDFWREEHLKGGYGFVTIPHIMRSRLWEISGHLDFYSENMYGPIEVEGSEYRLKPMNCPGHILIYKAGHRSYRDLPVRWAELGTVYRYERSGVLHGLMRVRGFTQDDAHIFMRPDQLDAEMERVIEFCLHILRSFGFTEFDVYLSTRDDQKKDGGGFVGSTQVWETATRALEGALKKTGLSYEVDEGGAAFYGPKIDIKIKDALGRSWQCSTIQLDFNLPERFAMTFIDSENREVQPIMIHRALLGSLERFFGVMIEHYAGAFPVWLSPEQVRVIPIADRHFDYAEKIRDDFRAAGIRAEMDLGSNRMNKKIREAQLQKVPYMLIVGDAEMEGETAALRLRDGRQLDARPVAEIAKVIKGYDERKENYEIWADDQSQSD